MRGDEMEECSRRIFHKIDRGLKGSLVSINQRLHMNG